ncbi:MAG: SDR family NAD(P)-dependent oxidoreductase [Dehalococcoidia bacterium]
MVGKLQDRHALITGGNSGIGEATARLFAVEGARVSILARREAEGNAVADSIERQGGGQATFFRCDVTDKDAIKKAVTAAVRKYGPVHSLFNNAGGAMPGEFPRESVDAFVATLDLNLVSAFNVTQAVWDHMLAAGGGAIVNMSSLAAVAGMSRAQRGAVPGIPNAGYGASKAALEAFTRYIAGSGANVGIRANAVRPGLILTPIQGRMPDGELVLGPYFDMTQLTPGPGYPEDVASTILFLSCDDSRFINGQVINIDGGVAGKVS